MPDNFLAMAVYAAPFVSALVLLTALIGIVTNFREARRAPYFRLRRAAARRGWRWVLVLLLSAVALGLSLAARTRFPTPDLGTLLMMPGSPSPAPSIGVLPTSAWVLDPSITPKSPNLAPPTITPTQPTSTPTTPPLIATIASSVTPSPNASLEIVATSSDISSGETPVEVGTDFPVGTRRIYYWLEFANMADGVSWSQVMLYNGSVIRSESDAWGWGEEGEAHYYFGAQEGWPEGAYEIRFYVGDQLLTSASYTVTGD